MHLVICTGQAITLFMAEFRGKFPKARISLKLHMLEDHTIGQLESFKAGLGKLNESGGETMHAEQNKDAKRAYPLQHQPLKRLVFLMSNHLVNHHPDVLAKSLKSKKNKPEQ